MMMPQQMQMPPMPAGLSMANFPRRMCFICFDFFEKIFCLAPMGGMSFLAPPPGFTAMGFNGQRF